MPLSHRRSKSFTGRLARAAAPLALAALCALARPATAHAQDGEPGEAGGNLAVSAPAGPPSQQFGFSLRYRQVFVPSWFLGLFTQEHTTLNSFHVGGEFVRRKGDMDIIIGVALQNMSPPDGNWLGRGKDPRIDTDYVQFKDFQMIGLDAAFVWHTNFNEWFGMHYGAGLGLGLLTGKVLRISAGTPGCASAPGDERVCYPQPCAQGPCTEAELRNLDGPPGTLERPGRYKEDSIPGAIPILNVLAGIDLHIPDVPGLEWRLLEGGFYNAFFLGSSITYLF